MKATLFFAVLATALSALANESALYLNQVKDSVVEIQKVKDSVTGNTKKYCPSATGNTQSECLNAYLKSATITNSSQFPLLAAVVVGSALYDKEQTHSSDTAKLAMLENLVLLLEKVDVKKFYLSKQPANAEVLMLRKDDEKLLESGKQKMLSNIIKLLGEAARSPASNVQTDQLSKRIDKIKSAVWKY